MSNAYLKTFTAGDINKDTLKDKGLVLVDFWAPWCGPCRMVGPIVEQLAEEYDGKVSIGKLNVDEEGQAAIDYGVSSIPTLILFKDGEIAERLVGARGKQSFVEMLEQYV